MMLREKTALLLSILSTLLPIVFVAIYFRIEPEFAEAIAAGLIVGCMSGSVTGVTALVLNRKRKNTLVTILSVLPIIPTVIFILLWVSYYSFG